jgi:hypothetical protein
VIEEEVQNTEGNELQNVVGMGILTWSSKKLLNS